ncbi:MAG: DUF4256 domain-containing protein [Bryobacterales bacterium]|nr:DUF4256 domain-containing protein [Bryobacterales bacterium]
MKIKPLTQKEQEQMLGALRARFDAHPQRHAGCDWKQVEARLTGHAAKLRALQAMEQSGGEPDVVGLDERSGEYLFADCAAETPKGRRSLCYDGAALASRKENKPAGSAMEMAAAMGVELMTEEEYRRLQQLGEFDLKTSSWLATPARIRTLGGALFGDRRFDTVFVYHNGAESYYAARGFRGMLRV